MRLLVEIALVVLAGVGVAVCVALLPDTRQTGRRRGPAPAPSRPAQLVSLERLVVSSGANGAVHAHAYLRPLLIEIVSHRLAAHGQTLDRMSVAVGRELLWATGCGTSSARSARSRMTGTVRGVVGRTRRDVGGARAALRVSVSLGTRLAGAGRDRGWWPGWAAVIPNWSLLAAPFLVFAGAGLILGRRAASDRADRARPHKAAGGRGRHGHGQRQKPITARGAALSSPPREAPS